MERLTYFSYNQSLTIAEFERILEIHFIYKKYRPLEFIEKYIPDYDGGNDYKKMIESLTDFADGFYLGAFKFKKIDAIYEILEFKTFYYYQYKPDHPPYIEKPFFTIHTENEKVLFYQNFNIKMPPPSIASQKERLKNFSFECYYDNIDFSFYDYPWTTNYQEVINNLHQEFELQRITRRDEIKVAISNDNSRYFDSIFKVPKDESRFTLELYRLKKIKSNNYICKMDTFILVKCKKELNKCYNLFTVLRVYDGEIENSLEYINEIIKYSSEKREDYLIQKVYWQKKGFYEKWSYFSRDNNFLFVSRRIKEFEEELARSCEYIKIEFTHSSKAEDYLWLLKYNYTKEKIENIIWECRVNEIIKYRYLITKNKSKDYKLYLRRDCDEYGIEVINYITIEIDSETGEYSDLYYIDYKDLNYEHSCEHSEEIEKMEYEEI